MSGTKTIRVPVRGGPEGKVYWTEVKVPVKLKKGETPPPPDETFPADTGSLITPEQRDHVLKGTGSSAAHIAQALEDKEDANPS